jgi:hypothetical protein
VDAVKITLRHASCIDTGSFQDRWIVLLQWDNEGKNETWDLLIDVEGSDKEPPGVWRVHIVQCVQD